MQSAAKPILSLLALVCSACATPRVQEICAGTVQLPKPVTIVSSSYEPDHPLPTPVLTSHVPRTSSSYKPAYGVVAAPLGEVPFALQTPPAIKDTLEDIATAKTSSGTAQSIITEPAREELNKEAVEPVIDEPRKDRLAAAAEYAKKAEEIFEPFRNTGRFKTRLENKLYRLQFQGDRNPRGDESPELHFGVNDTVDLLEIVVRNKGSGLTRSFLADNVFEPIVNGRSELRSIGEKIGEPIRAGTHAVISTMFGERVYGAIRSIGLGPTMNFDGQDFSWGIGAHKEMFGHNRYTGISFFIEPPRDNQSTTAFLSVNFSF